MRAVGLWAVGLALAISGCAEFALPGADPMASGRILFDCFRVDMEWGYRLDGIYIDSDGTVWRYDRSEPWFPSEQLPTVVSERDLLQKYQNAKRVGTIDAATLTRMVALIEPAGSGRVIRETTPYERSGNLDAAYRFDTRQRRYDLVFLNGGGAWVARNFSPEAAELQIWLDSVKKSVGFTSEE